MEGAHARLICLTQSLGVASHWLRRWMYRIFLYRASFQGEAVLLRLGPDCAGCFSIKPLFTKKAVLLRLSDPNVQVTARQQLSQAWAQGILWRRVGDAAEDLRRQLAGQLLASPLEQLIEANWSWYEPLMFQRQSLVVYASNFGEIALLLVPLRDIPSSLPLATARTS